jgi:hypothetical protein
MASGWMIGVMLTVEGEAAPLRHFFAVGHADRSKAEWTAVDRALTLGRMSESPVGGLEPVHPVAELTARTVQSLALKPGEVRPLGWKWPRRWLGQGG